MTSVPITLSLSKGCPYSFDAVGKEGQGFDKLSQSALGVTTNA